MNKKFAIVLALSLIAIVCCAGCIDPQDQVDPVTPPVDPVVPDVEYSVFFMLNYGDAGAYMAETVKAGEKVSKPANPSRSGYNFKGWFTAAEGGAAYDFTQAVNADLTLYAQWSKKSSSSSGSSSSGSSTPSAPTPEAVIGGQSYATVEEAIGAAQTGDTIALTENPDAPLSLGDKEVTLTYPEDTSIEDIKIKKDGASQVTVEVPYTNDDGADGTKTVIFEEVDGNELLVSSAAVDTLNKVGDAYTGSGLEYIASLVNEPLAAPVEDAPTEHVQDGWTVLFYEPAPTNLGDEAVDSESTDESKSWTITLKDDIYLEGKEWTPIGTNTNPFKGTFDGQGHTIHDLKITGSADYVGLIGYATGVANSDFNAVSNVWANNDLIETSIAESKYTTVIKNIKLDNVSVEGDERVGALVGFAENTHIYDCDVTSGAVKGTKYLGGLVGQMNDCVVKDCSNAAAVTGNGAYNYGGVIGAARGSAANAVINCMNTGTLDFTLTDGGSGGIVGQYSTAGIFVYNCENSGNIKVTSTVESNIVTGKAVAAGIVGTSGGAFDSVIANCKNSGAISTTTGSEISGQLSGIASNFGEGLIYNCINNGDISGNALYVGGICAAPGTTPLEINGCTNTGDLSNTNIGDAVSTVVAYCKGEVIYSNMAFADVAEFTASLPKREDSGKVSLTETVSVVLTTYY